MNDLPCKLFTGCKDKNGYGRVWVPKHKKVIGAHRAAYEEHHNVVLSSEEQVLHTCDNPPCIEPTHLFLGSHLENMKDKSAKGRQAQGEGHGMVTQSDDVVEQCRAMYTGKRGELTQLARRFGVSVATVFNWVNKKYR